MALNITLHTRELSAKDLEGRVATGLSYLNYLEMSRLGSDGWSFSESL